MKYKSNKDFAIRSIEIYYQNRIKVNYEFTFACGTLLNVLSSIIPDGCLIINLENADNLPKIDAKKEINIEEYFKIIRNGLAHKTNENFYDYDYEDEITAIKITCRNRKELVFNLNELDTIIDWLYDKLN